MMKTTVEALKIYRPVPGVTPSWGFWKHPQKDHDKFKVSPGQEVLYHTWITNSRYKWDEMLHNNRILSGSNL